MPLHCIQRRAFLAGLVNLAACSTFPPKPNLTERESAPTASAIPSKDVLLQYDGLGLAQLIKNKKICNTQVVNAAFQRIHKLDEQLNAMTTLVPQRAQARAATASLNSVFAGVPVVCKDLVDVSGVRRSNGSRIRLNNVPTSSVSYVQAMEKAGLSIIGLTNTPEFASIALTNNSVFGATRNPWALAYSPGGSSGGSAAAVAAGYVPIAHGTDGGGSNRIPASCCGVLGMKASRYRQLSGETNGEHLFLRTHQCLSRSVRDSAALLAHTERKGSGATYPPLGFIKGPSKRRLRIALCFESCLGQQPAPAVRTAIEDTAKLCDALGHSVEEIKNPIEADAFFKALEGIMLAGLPQLLALAEAQSKRPAEEAGLLSPVLVEMGRYAQRLPNTAYNNGLEYFRQLGLSMTDFFSQYDLMLGPVIPIETPKIGYITPTTTLDIALPRNRELLSYTALANGIGAPAMSVPLYHSSSNGLPIGSHFMAAPGEDKTLYELAYELEAALPWANRWAPYSAART